MVAVLLSDVELSAFNMAEHLVGLFICVLWQEYDTYNCVCVCCRDVLEPKGLWSGQLILMFSNPK